MKKLTTIISSLLMVASLCVMTSCDDEKDDKKNSKGIKGTENGYAWVDLGLPSGLKWATCNVGAANPGEYGDYFAWGETVPYGKEDRSNVNNYNYNAEQGTATNVKTYYGWETYKYCNGTSYSGLCKFGILPIPLTTITKYNADIEFGVVDNKNVLDLEDDAAHVNMGGRWRMPTKEEAEELMNNSYCEWTDNYNGKSVKGYIIFKAKADFDKCKYKNKEGIIYIYGFCDPPERSSVISTYTMNDLHIFLPSVGIRFEDSQEFRFVGDDNFWDAFYWLSSLESDFWACNLSFDIYDIGVGIEGTRYEGLSVRGVYK